MRTVGRLVARAIRRIPGFRRATAVAYTSGAMTNEYVSAMQNAEFETLEGGGVYGEIPGFRGVWAEGEDVATVRKELREVLRE